MCTACRAFNTPEQKHRDEQPPFRSSLCVSRRGMQMLCLSTVAARLRDRGRTKSPNSSAFTPSTSSAPSLGSLPGCWFEMEAGRAAQQHGSCFWAGMFHWRGISSNGSDLTPYKLNFWNTWLSRIDALSWLTTASTHCNSCLNSPHVFAAAAPEDKNVSLLWGSHWLCPSLAQEHQCCTCEDQEVRRCTGAEALCHTPEDAAENTDTLTVLFGDTNWISTITHTSAPGSGWFLWKISLWRPVTPRGLETPGCWIQWRKKHLLTDYVPKRIRDKMYPTRLWTWSCSMDVQTAERIS